MNTNLSRVDNIDCNCLQYFSFYNPKILGRQPTGYFDIRNPKTIFYLVQSSVRSRILVGKQNHRPIGAIRKVFERWESICTAKAKLVGAVLANSLLGNPCLGCWSKFMVSNHFWCKPKMRYDRFFRLRRIEGPILTRTSDCAALVLCNSISTNI